MFPRMVPPLPPTPGSTESTSAPKTQRTRHPGHGAAARPCCKVCRQQQGSRPGRCGGPNASHEKMVILQSFLSKKNHRDGHKAARPWSANLQGAKNCSGLCGACCKAHALGWDAPPLLSIGTRTICNAPNRLCTLPSLGAAREQGRRGTCARFTFKGVVRVTGVQGTPAWHCGG
jgi:hypothetical protein